MSTLLTPSVASVTAVSPVRSLDQELDWARTEGPVRTITIPPCPELLTRLQAVMGEADPDWDAICSIASADVAMAASLVRAANSPLYARNSTIQSVPQAINLLGLRQTSQLLMQFMTARALSTNHPLLEHFWRTSARRALAMGYIARQLYGVPPDLAHTCGLFCDVGVPLLLQGLRGYAGTWIEAHARQDRLITSTEQAAHHTDHTIVGALVARTWQLAPELKVAIRLHHDPHALADTQLGEDVRNLIAASTVAEHLVAAHEGHPDTPEWVQRGHLCLVHLQVHADELVLWQDNLQDALDHVQ